MGTHKEGDSSVERPRFKQWATVQQTRELAMHLCYRRAESRSQSCLLYTTCKIIPLLAVIASTILTTITVVVYTLHVELSRLTDPMPTPQCLDNVPSHHVGQLFSSRTGLSGISIYNSIQERHAVNGLCLVIFLSDASPAYLNGSVLL